MSRDDEVEILFAEPVEGGFRLEKSPFYVYGVSYLDVVAADAGSDRWLFTHVKKRSGHSTYRVLLNGKHQEAEFKTRWPELKTLGCTYEEGGKPEHRLYAIDIPPDADVHEAYRLLEQGENDGAWLFEEGHHDSGGPDRHLLDSFRNDLSPPT